MAVCLDCDPAGRAAASRVAADLAGIAAEVRVVDIQTLCESTESTESTESGESGEPSEDEPSE